MNVSDEQFINDTNLDGVLTTEKFSNEITLVTNAKGRSDAGKLMSFIQILADEVIQVKQITMKEIRNIAISFCYAFVKTDVFLGVGGTI